MKTILLHVPGFEQGKLFDPDVRDNALEPFIYLRDTLSARGYRLVTADNHPVEECHGIWFWDVPFRYRSFKGMVYQLIRRFRSASPVSAELSPQRNLYADCIKAGKQEALTLFLSEPPSVVPENYDRRFHRGFSRILTWNDSVVDGKKYFKYFLPLPSHIPPIEQVPFQQKKLLVTISANKSSRFPTQLYSARTHSIRYFEQHYPEQFDLFGIGWDRPAKGQPAFTSYRGTVRHKWDVMPRYRFSLCYENVAGIPGYVSEKIFDCMRANCVPVYWGASNIEQYVPSDAFIDRRRFQSDAELAEFLMGIDEPRYQRYLAAIRDYLQTDQFRQFLPPAFVENIITTLDL